MKSFCLALIASISIVAALSSPASAAPDPSPDPNATVVYLRTSCDVANLPLKNCFEDMTNLQTWIYARANPSSKLLIEMGPGQFGVFRCPGTVGGELTFSGAGVGKTIIGKPTTAIAVANGYCTAAKWAFENLTIMGSYAVAWTGGGETSWSNTSIEGAWYEGLNPSTGDVCPAGQQGTHRFFSSRVVVKSGPAAETFLNVCGDDWLWGSEILYTNVTQPSGTAIYSEGAGNRIHLYGSNVRAELPANAGATGTLTGITVLDSAEVHSHGVGIDVVAKAGWTATALNASSSGEIHAFESSYFFGSSTTGITIQRIVNNGGHVHAPFQWAPHSAPPTIQSVDGADTAIVTSTTSGIHPHMVVYDTTCTSTWYDMTDKICRP